MKVGEFFVQLGFKNEDTKLKDFIKACGDLDLRSVTSALGVGALYEAIKSVMEIADKTAMGVVHFTRETGMSGEKMQQWSNLAKQMGLSTEDVVGSVKHLQDSVARMKLTGEGAQGWMMLGIDPTTAKDSFELLSRIREALKSLTPEYQRLALSQLGLSDSMLSMMNVSDAVWNSVNDLTSNTKEQINTLALYHAAWSKMQSEWGILITALGSGLAPVLKYITMWMTVLIGTFSKVTSALGEMSTAFGLLGLAAWATGLGPVVTAIGLIAAGIMAIVRNWEKLQKIGGWFQEKAERINNLRTQLSTPWGIAGTGLSMLAAPSQPIASSSITSSSKTVNNRPVFNITGENPEDIARKIEEHWNRMISDSEYQTRE